MESVVYDRLESLDKSSTNWKIKVRVTRMWPSVTAEHGSLKGFNLILLDDDNAHVHAFAYHNIWNALTTPIVEGDVYVIDQFSVKDSAGPLKVVQSKLCIRFTNFTTVEKVEDDGMIPVHKFEFLDLGDLFAEASKYQPKENPEFATDVIGVLEEFENVRKITTKFGDRDIVKFRICDSSNAHKVSVWGDLAVSVEEMHGKELEEPIIAIVTSTKVQTWLNSVQIGTLPSSKVYLNLDDETVTDMRQRLKSENYKSKADKALQSLGSDPISAFFEKLSLKDLNEKLTYDHLKKKLFCTFTIPKVDDESSWWFYSCSTCQFEVERIDTRFKCNDCPRTMPVASKRCQISKVDNSVLNIKSRLGFRIMVLAEDETFACNIVLMDRVVRKLIGTTAAKLIHDLKKVPEEGLPKLVANMVGKKVSVKMSLTKNNITEDNTIFCADDIYETTMATTTGSDSPSISEYSSFNLTDSLEGDDQFVPTPGSAKSVTKKVKVEA